MRLQATGKQRLQRFHATHIQRRRKMKTANDMIQEKGSDILCVPEGTTVLEALKQMNKHKVGAIMVTRSGKPVGIWTERDLMRNTLDAAFDPKTVHIEDYMTRDLIFAPHTDTVYNLMDKFLGLRVRHLLIEKDGKTIGMVSSGSGLSGVRLNGWVSGVPAFFASRTFWL